MLGQRRALWVVVVVVIVVGRSERANGRATLDSQLVVHVEHYAGLTPNAMAMVRSEVDTIFRLAGATLAWAPPLLRPIDQAPRDGSCHFALVILNIDTPFGGAPEDGPDVLGRAAPGRGRAWVFANRVRDVTDEGRIDATLLLARVIAHELGHLLLRSRRHSTGTIMRPHLEADAVGLHEFNADESRTIGATIASCAASQ